MSLTRDVWRNLVWEDENNVGRDALLVSQTVARWMPQRGEPTAYPSHRSIATKARMSERSVRRALAELVEAGWLQIEPNGRRTSNGATSLYRARAPDGYGQAGRRRYGQTGRTGYGQNDGGVRPGIEGGTASLTDDHREEHKRNTSSAREDAARSVVIEHVETTLHHIISEQVAGHIVDEVCAKSRDPVGDRAAYLRKAVEGVSEKDLRKWIAAASPTRSGILTRSENEDPWNTPTERTA